MNYDDEVNTDYSLKVREVTPVQNIGIEDLKIIRSPNEKSTSGHPCNIIINFAINCWVRGVESYKAACHHIGISTSSHCEISGCYLHEAMDYGGGGWGYGVTMGASTTNTLVENNIFRYLRHAMVAGAGSNCNVWTFNYSREQHSTYWLGIGYDDRDLDLHAKYPFGHLFEHNIVERIASDDYHGDNGLYNTFVRNMATGGIALIKTMHEWATLGNMEKQGDWLYPLRFNWIGDAVPATDAYGILNDYTFDVTHNVAYDGPGYSAYRLDDVSYYYSSKPEFLDGYTWPAIGPKTQTGGELSYSIPAEERFNSPQKTYVENPTPKPFTTSGILSYDETWSVTHSLTGHVFVPSGVTLTISNSTNINLNGYSIVSTGGIIAIESGATINPSNSHTRLITGSAIKGIYSTIASAMSAASSGQSIEVYGSHTLAANLTVPSGVTLTFKNGSDITLDSHTIQKGSGSLAIESGASFTPDIRLMSGSTVLGLYTTIDDAFNNGSELHLRGEFIFNDTYTLTSGRKLVAQDGALLKYPSGKTLEIAGGAILEGNNATFTSISGTWGGIYYQENSSGSLSGCTITHATTAIRDHSGKTGQDALVLSSNTISDASYGISSLNSSTYIFYNHLTNISSRAIYSGLNGTPVITFNEISNSEYGIYCVNGCTPYISENTVSDIEAYAIYSSDPNGSVVISNNELSNTGYGIMSLNVPAGSEISDNTISNASTFGLYVYNGSPLIESNAITESGLFGLYFVNSNSEMHNNLITGGSGNYAFIMYSSSPDLYYNTISTTDALWAVYANNGSDPLFGQYENYTYTGFNYMSSGESSEGVILASNASTPVMGGHIPQVWGNCKNSIIWQGTYYAAVASDGTSSIDARRCWWGQPSASACYGDVLTTYPLQSDPGSGSTLSKSSPESVIASHPEEEPGDEAAKALWEVAMGAVWEKNYTGALDDFQTLIRLYPVSTYAYRALSMSVRLCREQKTRDMLTYLDELLTGVEDKTLRAVIKSRKVSEYRRMKDTKQAIALSREILAENPETIHETTALFDLFNLYDKDLADSVQAEYYLTELKTKYPEDELTGIARLDRGEDPDQIVIRKRTLPGQEEEILPEVFILGSAYPNPFNPVTRLTYSLPDAGDLVFEVVDITGRIVDRIAFSNHPAGKHHFDYTASHLSTGLYIVRARYNRQVQIRKIVYMK
ncbi:right-handed parallel beta-helix repeat-containing protein [Fidelibacter multiformis]|uniref:right-handed parallel beta-helix repeat-containing protein n=1 Tax=Fidelibacter multiformis TaxID=3377529 RepID=UPI0037DD44D7